jgi:uridylate kinase
MAGPKQVDRATKGLNALVDEFTSAVKELVNAGEETAVHLAVGGGRAIRAIIDATGEVTKVTVETAGNVSGSIGSSVSRIAKGESGQEQEEETKEKK